MTDLPYNKQGMLIEVPCATLQSQEVGYKSFTGMHAALLLYILWNIVNISVAIQMTTAENCHLNSNSNSKLLLLVNQIA